MSGPSDAQRTVATTGNDERFGSYVILERLGKGGMAEVHRARLERGADFAKIVALKRVLPGLAQENNFRARFIEEARTVAELQHPNVVQVFDFGELHGRPYLVMELVDGIDLWRMAGLCKHAKRPFGIPAAMFIIAEAARGLGYAHSLKRDGKLLGIVHRDVSPQNLLVSRLGEVKVADFGIAKATATGDGPHTTAGIVMGKLRYMAPEQVMGVPLDARTDTFGLGLVLHELLTGSPLLDSPSPAGIVQQIKECAFEPPSVKNPEVPPALDAIVMTAIAREPDDRYLRAEDLARALSALLAEIAPGFDREALSERVIADLKELATLRPRVAAAPAPSSRPSDVISVEVSERSVISEDTVSGLVPSPEHDLMALKTGAILREGQSGPAEEYEAIGSVTGQVSQPNPSVRNTREGQLLLVATAIVIVVAGALGVRLALQSDRPIGPGAEARTAYAQGQEALAAGRHAEAERAFERALTIDPGYASAYRELGRAYGRDGQKARAIEALRAYLKSAPTGADSETVRAELERLERP